MKKVLFPLFQDLKIIINKVYLQTNKFYAIVFKTVFEVKNFVQ